MDEQTRITKDITMFEDNIKKATISTTNESIVELASQYYEDAKYYLGKKDYFTAFGCINYAHGLLDAMIKF
ncbi:MAG: DUF357 domain-containing protein [Candidatus Thermoplasmatota archaeon]|nr:DUF357 domain-containing protein [Candidatus Thermoplasmatota archaeon]